MLKSGPHLKPLEMKDHEANKRRRIIAGIIREARMLANAKPFTDDELIENARVVGEAITGIPTARLMDCYRSAVAIRTSGDKVIGFADLRSAWTSICAMERATTPDVGGYRCRFCEDSHWQPVFDREKAGQWGGNYGTFVVPCACDGSTKYQEPEWVKSTSGRWERATDAETKTN